MVPYIDMLTFKLPQCSFKSLILADIESFAFLFNFVLTLNIRIRIYNIRRLLFKYLNIGIYLCYTARQSAKIKYSQTEHTKVSSTGLQ